VNPMHAPRILALLFAILLAGCGGPSLTPAQVSERFFDQCALGKFSEVYADTTLSFRVEKTAKYFEARVRDLGFDKVKKFEWQEPVIKGEVAQRWGDLTLNDGEKMTVIVTMHRDGKSWRLHEMTNVSGTYRDDLFSVQPRSKDTRKTGAAFREPVAMEPPTERLVRKLVEKSLSEFNTALQAKDFSDFVNGVSERWKFRGQSKQEMENDLMNEADRITVPKLNHAFAGFIQAGSVLNPIFESIPKSEMKLYEPARITSDGVLLCEGEFATTPSKVHFKFEYFFEGGNWRLFGVTVNLKK
jgi:hypothetical protein